MNSDYGRTEGPGDCRLAPINLQRKHGKNTAVGCTPWQIGLSLRGSGQRRESVREVGGSRDGVIPKKSLLSTEEYHVLSEKQQMVSIRGQPWFMRPESRTQ